MRRNGGWLISGLIVVGMLAAVWPAQAEGISDFKLARAIPADAMVAVYTRNHAGKEFVNTQFQRVWKAVSKQRFDRTVKGAIRDMVAAQNGDVEAFDAQWQQTMDLAAGVTWSRLGERESAFAMKLAPPLGAEWICLMMPPNENLENDFNGMAAMLKGLVGLAPEGMFSLGTDGEGTTVTHRVSFTGAPIPVTLTLARHEDVLLVGFGSGMVEQSLSLLRGETDPSVGTLVATKRFKKAFEKLSPPTDTFYFMDVANVMKSARAFAQMAVAATTTAPAEGVPAEGPLSFLPKLVDRLDLWEYLAGVATTTGMKTDAESIVALRADAKKSPLYPVFYGRKPLQQPLKNVPEQATSVSTSTGIDLHALYGAAIEFIREEVVGGEDLITQWEMMKVQMPLDVETDLLQWVDGTYVSFTVPGRTAYSTPQWLWMIKTKDEAKTTEVLDRIYAMLNEMLAEQNGGVEDAEIEGVEGFKEIILPPIAAMLVGRPSVGLKDGWLFVANGPQAVQLALQTAAGDAKGFAQGERYREEGLPLEGDVTAFSFKDLGKMGEEFGTQLQLAAFVLQQAGLSKEPGMRTALNLLTKLGNVVREFNFLHSSCSVTTFSDNASLTKTVTHYNEPPAPKRRQETQPKTDEPEKTESDAGETSGGK